MFKGGGERPSPPPHTLFTPLREGGVGSDGGLRLQLEEGAQRGVCAGGARPSPRTRSAAPALGRRGRKEGGGWRADPSALGRVSKARGRSGPQWGAGDRSVCGGQLEREREAVEGPRAKQRCACAARPERRGGEGASRKRAPASRWAASVHLGLARLRPCAWCFSRICSVARPLALLRERTRVSFGGWRY